MKLKIKICTDGHKSPVATNQNKKKQKLTPHWTEHRPRSAVALLDASLGRLGGIQLKELGEGCRVGAAAVDVEEAWSAHLLARSEGRGVLARR